MQQVGESHQQRARYPAMRLINDLLDYSQARVGRTAFGSSDKRPTSMSLRRSAVDELEFAQRGHTVRVRGPKATASG